MTKSEQDREERIAESAEPADPSTWSGDNADASSALTTAQHLMWTGQQIHAGAPLYNMILAFRIRGPIEVDRFVAAWHSVVASSDSLRTTIAQQPDGRPIRRVGQDGPATEFVDLSEQEDAETAYRLFVEDRRVRVFDLGHALTDSVLLRLEEDDYVWYLNQHHLITDGWSAALVFQYVEQAYRESHDFRRNAVPQYSEYVAFERRHRASRLFQKAISYWKDRLAIRTRSVSLYGRLLDGARPTTNRSVVELGESRSTRIREEARNAMPGALTEDVGLFNIFMASLVAYLYRVSGQSHLRIGAPAHNRPRPDLKRTIGLFIEVLPFEVEIDEDETFDTLLQKVALETSRFLKLAQPGISSTRTNTSFNVLLNFIHASFPSFAGLPTETEWIHTRYGDAAHHLRLQVHDFDLDGGFSLHFDFNTDLLDNQEQIDAGQHFTRILDGMLEDRGRRINDVGLLTDQQRARVLAFSEGDFNGEIGGTVPDTIVSIANSNPDSCAVRDGAREITYSQLAVQSENVTAALRQHGVKDGEYVGILVDRSADLLPAILGVLRAGAAYVPLDPADPAPRLSTIIEDSGIRVVLCTTASAAPVSSQALTVVDIQEAVTYTGPRADLMPLRPQAAAYVIYTSGSTGRPKGVVVTHGSLSNYVGWARSTYAPDRAVSMPLYTSHSFDLTVTSLFLPLATGGSVVFYSPDPGGPDTSILRVVNDDDVDVLKLTPSHFAILRDSVTIPKRIKTLIFGGEALRRDVAEDAMRVFGRDVAIFNEYGPTEATVGCMIHRFDPDRDVESDVPIGHPIARTRVYLLDEGLEPVPPGVAGELMVGGAGVAEGYHGKQDLTADRFVASPFTPGDRLYRTGDLGVMDSSGLIHYRGRTDRQLKIHGYRIERGEVEAALLAHPAVNDCIVTVVTNENTGDRVIQRCVRCGLGSDYPGTAFDDRGVCNTCTDYDRYRERALDFFGGMDDLHAILKRECARKTGQYDCLVLLSGGKDSTYLLYQMVETGRNVLAFTLDNGFISESAKENIDRVVRHIGVDHIYGTTPAMNEIFVDSLNRFANVCNGCFKTIYTLAIKEAKSRGIPVIVTGLSRGQLFETRLSGDLFSGDAVPIESIEETILTARKTYHHLDDAVSRLLKVDDIIDGSTFDEVAFVDFYRYCDVELEEVYRFLSTRAPWIRPGDTGRSTNCLINEAGIFVHKRKRGFHNYAWPYSWDVRMGHKVRDDALEELDDNIDPDRVLEMLHEIGYSDFATEPVSRLAVYYSANRDCTASELRDFLSARLPEYMVPAVYVAMEALPRTAAGKADLDALPRPSGRERTLDAPAVEPRNDVERALASIWRDALGVDSVGVRDNFFDLGGDSIVAIQIVARANREGIQISPAQLFRGQTVEALAGEHRNQSAVPDDDQPESDGQNGSSQFSPDQLRRIAELLGKSDNDSQA